MKFGQFIEHNMRNIFLEKSYTKFDGEIILRPSCVKIKIKHISGSIVLSFIQFVFIACQVEDYQNIVKLNCEPFDLISYRAFLKNRKRSGTSLPASFSA